MNGKKGVAHRALVILFDQCPNDIESTDHGDGRQTIAYHRRTAQRVLYKNGIVLESLERTLRRAGYKTVVSTHNHKKRWKVWKRG